MIAKEAALGPGVGCVTNLSTSRSGLGLRSSAFQERPTSALQHENSALNELLNSMPGSGAQPWHQQLGATLASRATATGATPLSGATQMQVLLNIINQQSSSTAQQIRSQAVGQAFGASQAAGQVGHTAPSSLGFDALLNSRISQQSSSAPLGVNNTPATPQAQAFSSLQQNTVATNGLGASSDAQGPGVMSCNQM